MKIIVLSILVFPIYACQNIRDGPDMEYHWEEQACFHDWTDSEDPERKLVFSSVTDPSYTGIITLYENDMETESKPYVLQSDGQTIMIGENGTLSGCERLMHDHIRVNGSLQECLRGYAKEEQIILFISE